MEIVMFVRSEEIEGVLKQTEFMSKVCEEGLEGSVRKGGNDD